MNKDNNVLDVCPVCEEETLHIYTQEQGVYSFCECCGFENKRD